MLRFWFAHSFAFIVAFILGAHAAHAEKALAALQPLSKSSQLPVETEFERFIAKEGGLPASFVGMLRRGIEFTRYYYNSSSSDSVTATATGDSRSAKRKFVSLARPRLIGTLGDTLVAFTEGDHSLEAISMNHRRGRAEFYVGSNYGIPGRNLTIHRLNEVERAACLGCHQHGGPIFPQQGWNEMAGGVSAFSTTNVEGEIAQARRASGLPALVGFDLSKRPVKEEFSAGGIDGAVGNFNHALQRDRVCITACGSSLECRRDLVISILIRNMHLYSKPADQRSMAEKVEQRARERVSAAWKKHWPADGFAWIDSTIPDRYPGQAFTADSPLNPAAPRELTGAIPVEQVESANISTQHASCIDFEAVEWDFLDAYAPGQIDQAFRTSNAGVAATLANWPPSGEQLRSSIRAALGEIDGIAAHPAQNDEMKITPIESNPTAQSKLPFVRHCSSCHGPESPLGSPLPLNNLAKLRSYKNGLVLKRIGGKSGSIMPPPTTPNLPALTEGERNEMIELLQK